MKITRKELLNKWFSFFESKKHLPVNFLCGASIFPSPRYDLAPFTDFVYTKHQHASSSLSFGPHK